MRALTLRFSDAPPTANLMWRQAGARTFVSKAAADWYKLVALELAGAKAPEDWRYYKVEIVVEPKRRQGDVDNRIKPVLDALTKAGFWKDDKDVAFVSCRFGRVNKEGRTTVVVSEMFEKFGDGRTLFETS